MSLAYFLGHPPLSGRIRVVPEDFQVFEELGFGPSGGGEHVLLRIRKRAVNTEWVSRQLAVHAGVPKAAVSYAGLKDRHAVAEQWFTVHLPGRAEPDWAQCGGEDFTVLEHHRHARKLRIGALKGNAFRIVIRDLQGESDGLAERLERLAQNGVPNYFGAQRFGHDGDNLLKAEALFLGRLRVRDRHQRGLYLSAARAQVFNQVLSRRVAQGSWNQPVAGDVMMLDGSHSVFRSATVDADIQQRMRDCDIHPTGPLWGRGELLSQEGVEALERTVAAEYPIFCQGLEAAGMKQERRALRMPVRNMALERPADGSAVISFRLPAGAYATVVLRELVGIVD
ncbi:MAG: tRNA pseudouridine(13) synthase TruD [Gammaproteobacteria bacterium]|nr:tRNA pseudouridine(13) synthase TruD [Gammaproteobacteria bacterium]MCP5423637.1 tRNA pseudouridine(13) synthase TruD [Gammaproteobacteria bacterium]MCP5459890.1 tRNA pseudouridine(13) synthase TruD [Gammaproteobacteria bacterium]